MTYIIHTKIREQHSDKQPPLINNDMPHHHDPHFSPDFVSWLVAAINRIDAKLNRVMHILIRQGVLNMSTLQDIQDAVAHETDVTQSAVTLLQHLSDQLQAAITANDPAAIQAIADAINANADALAQAVVANTPSAPPADA